MRHWMLLLVVALVLALGVLATLQVRWITDVSAGRQQRLTAELDAAAQRFDEELQRELERVAVAQPTPDAMMPQLAAEPARRLFATENRDGFDVAIAHADRIVVRSNPAWPRAVDGAGEDLARPILAAQVERAGAPWQLLVRHHGEPLDAMFAHARHRDLAIAFVGLFILGASAVVFAVALRRAQRSGRQQLEFVAGITHELHTPLAALASAGQNLADRVPVDAARYGAMIVKETRRLIDLVDQALQFSELGQRTAPRRDQLLDAGAAVSDAIAQCRVLAEERAVTIESHVEDALPGVPGDPAAVTRAVRNLVANAIVHGGDGGWVGVRAGADDGSVVITVEDRGAGIAAADLPHLFEPFYRGRNAQTRGTGIGLAIVDRIARAHGGSIFVAARRERGAAFTLRIPAARNAA